MAAKQQITCLISIDTEEEWDWSADFPNENASVSNIQELPAFQALCNNLGLKPTYFCDYAVLQNQVSCAVIKALHESGSVEIAAHLHPWVNPPFYGVTDEYRSHVINLPLEQVNAKLQVLTEKIKETIGVQPQAFRTGRWGISHGVYSLLEKHGYLYDSSIYPLYYHQYFDCSSARSKIYFPNYSSPNEIEATPGSSHIIEIPVTTGFNRGNYSLVNPIHHLLSKRPLSFLRLNGVLWHLGLMRKLYLSPELCSAGDMYTLAKRSIVEGNDTLHMYLHSSSLLDGANGMSYSQHSREKITSIMTEFMELLTNDYDVIGKTVSEHGRDWYQSRVEN